MTKTSAPPRPFETRRLATATGHVRVDEAGEGDLALLLSRDRQASALADRLAARFRTGLVDPADADEIGALDLADANLLAQGRDAAAALRAVAVRPGAIGSLVLLAPVFFDAKGAPVDAALAEAASGLDRPTMSLSGVGYCRRLMWSSSMMQAPISPTSGPTRSPRSSRIFWRGGIVSSSARNPACCFPEDAQPSTRTRSSRPGARSARAGTMSAKTLRQTSATMLLAAPPRSDMWIN
jgi:hypothetical protein